MQKKTLKGTRQHEVKTKSLLRLEYYVVEKRLSTHENYYGIAIEQTKITDGISDTSEYDCLMISEDKDWVETMINKMIVYSVTPTTLGSVIDDMLTGMPC